MVKCAKDFEQKELECSDSFFGEACVEYDYFKFFDTDCTTFLDSVRDIKEANPNDEKLNEVLDLIIKTVCDFDSYDVKVNNINIAKLMNFQF